MGWGLAVGVFALIYSFVPQDMAWRVMFIVGLLPSFLIFWVRRNVQEPDSFQRLQKEKAIPQSFFKSLAGIFRPELLRVTLFGGLLGLGAHGGYHACVRGAGVGFCYNFGRVLSAVFPFLVGHMSDSMALGSAIGIDAGIAYDVAVIAALCLPETRGRSLEATNTTVPVSVNGNESARA